MSDCHWTDRDSIDFMGCECRPLITHPFHSSPGLFCHAHSSPIRWRVFTKPSFFVVVGMPCPLCLLKPCFVAATESLQSIVAEAVFCVAV